MRHFRVNLFLIIFLSAIFSCQEKGTTIEKTDATKVKILNSSYDFGEMTIEDSVKHDFYLQNSGNKPLIIKDVKASCGCTIPSFSKKPVHPGDSAKISVIFKPNETNVGIIKKSIVIQANTDSVFHVLYIYGDVLKN